MVEQKESVESDNEDEDEIVPKKLTAEEKRLKRKQEIEEETKRVLASCKNMPTSLVPEETDDEVITDLKNDDDEVGLWLFDMIHVKSSDVGFTWKTSMLLYRIMCWAKEAETVDDFVSSLKYYHRGDTLYNFCKNHVQEIFEKGQELKEKDLY